MRTLKLVGAVVRLKRNPMIDNLIDLEHVDHVLAKL